MAFYTVSTMIVSCYVRMSFTWWWPVWQYWMSTLDCECRRSTVIIMTFFICHGTGVDLTCFFTWWWPGRQCWMSMLDCECRRSIVNGDADMNLYSVLCGVTVWSSRARWVYTRYTCCIVRVYSVEHVSCCFCWFPLCYHLGESVSCLLYRQACRQLG